MSTSACAPRAAAGKAALEGPGGDGHRTQGRSGAHFGVPPGDASGASYHALRLEKLYGLDQVVLKDGQPPFLAMETTAQGGRARQGGHAQDSGHRTSRNMRMTVSAFALQGLLRDGVQDKLFMMMM